jgi:hypothetical protein
MLKLLLFDQQQWQQSRMAQRFPLPGLGPDRHETRTCRHCKFLKLRIGAMREMPVG